MHGVRDIPDIVAFYDSAESAFVLVISSAHEGGAISVTYRDGVEQTLCVLPRRPHRFCWPLPGALIKDADYLDVHREGSDSLRLRFEPQLSHAAESVEFVQFDSNDLTKPPSTEERLLTATSRGGWSGEPFAAKACFSVPFRRDGDSIAFGRTIDTEGVESNLISLNVEISEFRHPCLTTTIEQTRFDFGYSEDKITSPTLTLDRAPTGDDANDLYYVLWRFPQSERKPNRWPLSDLLSSSEATVEPSYEPNGFHEYGAYRRAEIEQYDVPFAAPRLEIGSSGTTQVKMAGVGLMDIFGIVSVRNAPWIKTATEARADAPGRHRFFQVHDARVLSGSPLDSGGIKPYSPTQADLAKLAPNGREPAALASTSSQLAIKMAVADLELLDNPYIHLNYYIQKFTSGLAPKEPLKGRPREASICVLAKKLDGAGDAEARWLAELSPTLQAELIKSRFEGKLDLDVVAKIGIRPNSGDLVSNIFGDLADILTIKWSPLALKMYPVQLESYQEIRRNLASIVSHIQTIKRDLDLIAGCDAIPLSDPVSILAEALTSNADATPDISELDHRQRALIEALRTVQISHYLQAAIHEKSNFHRTFGDALHWLRDQMADRRMTDTALDGDGLYDVCTAFALGVQRIQQLYEHEPHEEMETPDWSTCRQEENWQSHHNDVWVQIDEVRQLLSHATGVVNGQNGERRIPDALNLIEEHAEWLAHRAVWRELNQTIERRIESLEPDERSAHHDEISRYRMLRQGPPATWPGVAQRIQLVLSGQAPSGP